MGSPENIRLDENEQLLNRIGSLNAVPSEEVKDYEVKRWHDLDKKRTLINIFEYRRLTRKYIGSSLSRRARVEREQQLLQLVETLYDIPSRMYSYGVYAPTYLDALALQKEKGGTSSDHHTSLLLGALTPDTIREYSATVAQEYPDAKKLVVDFGGEETRKVPSTIAYNLGGDARILPFRHNSISSIHTNILFGWMKSSRDVPSILEEAYRVLEPNGILICVEPIQAVAKGAPKQLIEAVGFEDVTLDPAFKFYNRRTMERFLYSNAKPTNIEISSTCVLLASKPRRERYK